jgi:hypothetical protein
MLKIIFFVIILELLIKIIIRKTKKSFLWFINRTDMYQIFDKSRYKFFSENSFSKKLRWIKKYNSISFDRIGLKRIKFKILNN